MLWFLEDSFLILLIQISISDLGSVNWSVKVSWFRRQCRPGVVVGARGSEVNQSERSDAPGSVELLLQPMSDPAKWVREQHGCIYI